MLNFAFGLFCYTLAISMFFFFPGVEDWAFSALPSIPVAYALGFNTLLVFLVVLPALSGPLLLIVRAGRYVRCKLALGCLALSVIFLLAAPQSFLLYGRVALLALLTGQVLAIGHKARESVPFNWMVYFGYALANFNFPDSAILTGANYLAGVYLLAAGFLILQGTWKTEEEKSGGFRVMVG